MEIEIESNQLPSLFTSTLSRHFGTYNIRTLPNLLRRFLAFSTLWQLGLKLINAIDKSTCGFNDDAILFELVLVEAKN
jgi:hypothetical protein